MSIIRFSDDLDTSSQFEEFCLQNGNPSQDEIITWIRLWKLWGRLNERIVKDKSIHKTLEFAINFEKFSPSVLSEKSAKEIYAQAKDFGATILVPTSKNYPERLRKIGDFPMVLYATGNIDLLQKPMFAIVGSRSASAEALQISYNFAKELSQNGYTIVSGFANGVDTSACKGALDYGTVQVLGSGLKVPYPKDNSSLFKDVLKNGGTFLSEFPVAFPAKPNNFPIRNRIITGLSYGVLIGQVNRKNGVSGTLVTLRIAMNQGREIFTYPGSILDERYSVCNNLLKNGVAHFTTSVEDIVKVLEPYLKGYKAPEKKYQSEQNVLNVFETHSKQDVSKDKEIQFSNNDIIKIKDLISTTPISSNELSSITGFHISLIHEALSELELLGIIESNHIGMYMKKL